jgi:transcriptional regulator with XRE-family HTH domain
MTNNSHEGAPTPQYRTFAERLRATRRALHWTQRDLAAHLADAGYNIPAGQIGNWEVSKNEPRGLVDIAEALERVTADTDHPRSRYWWVGWEGDERPKTQAA